jgi:hypothetical protein
MGFHDITQLSASQDLGANSGSGDQRKLWASQAGVTVLNKGAHKAEEGV